MSDLVQELLEIINDRYLDDTMKVEQIKQLLEDYDE